MRSSACINCVRQLWFSVAPAVRFRDVAHPVSAGHKCSGKAVSTMRVSLCASPLSSPHPGRMLRRECLHLPPFFALPFALFPPCLLYLRKCLVMFLSSVQGKVSQSCHSRVVKQDLCSNLCSTPVIAIATDPSDPVNGGS